MLKGAKKAIVRTPHRLLGNKSIEDKIIIDWTKDFVTADEALSQVARETKKFASTWRDICSAQESLSLAFREIYEPIRDENAYRVVQETPESSLTAVAQFSEFVGSAMKDAIDPYLQSLEGPFSTRIGEAQECLKSVQKLLTKREHKKVDFDRNNNALERLNKKRHGGEALSEKEQTSLAHQEQELEAATEMFHELDEKVKSTVPYVLTYMSEFLNHMTVSLYLTQLKVFEEAQRLLANYAQPQGLSGHLVSTGVTSPQRSTNGLGTTGPSPSPLFTGEPSDYVNILDSWEARYVITQPRYEEGILTIKEGKTVETPIGQERLARRQQAMERAQHKTKNVVKTGLHATQGLVHKAFSFVPNRYVKDIQFSSAELGFFSAEADLLQAAEHDANHLHGIMSTPTSPVSGGAGVSGHHSSASVGGVGTFGAGFSFFRRPSPTTSNTSLAKTHSSQGPVRSPSTRSARTLSMTEDSAGLGFHYGRSPVTSFEDVAAEAAEEREAKEALRTRVRASMSTAARTWTLGDEVSDRLRSRTVLGEPTPQRNIAPENERARALFTFGGEEAGDVSFQAGDELTILDHGDETDDQWWFGQTQDGRVGLFPQTYVQVL
ncbi:uncharacterized protein SAPINGB_P000055 [Magnusiomyces paraingens]|uniref:SH3 domain-containing protein n=1 Tax=Magnusiomyces paraingens TaxID=2606893 RepID=A0A5E8AX41_9ASCO|nr:uncharacterized protein SAPINGB_P000055 [Saprochaete ingens]VVT43597.1 unnamed protein product [Saprochaete ingens]